MGTKTVIKASTTDQNRATRSSGKQMVRNSAGRLWTGDMSSSGVLTWYYSDNDGQTWNTASTTYSTGESAQIAWAIDINDNDDIFLIHRADLISSGTRIDLEVFTEATNDLTAGGTPLSWTGAVTANQGMDLVVQPHPTTPGDYVIHVVSGYWASNVDYLVYMRASCTSTYTLASMLAATAVFTGSNSTTEPDVAPRIDWSHQGDGLTPRYWNFAGGSTFPAQKDYSIAYTWKTYNASVASNSKTMISGAYYGGGTTWTYYTSGTGKQHVIWNGNQDAGVGEIQTDIGFDGLKFWGVTTDSRSSGGADNDIAVTFFDVIDGMASQQSILTYSAANSNWEYNTTINSSSTVSTTAVAMQVYPGRPDPDQQGHSYVRLYTYDADDSKLYYADLTFPEMTWSAWTLLEDTTYSGHGGIRNVKYDAKEIIYWTEPNGANWDKVCNVYNTWETILPSTADTSITRQPHAIAGYSNIEPLFLTNLNSTTSAPWDTADNGVIWVAGRTDAATAAAADPAVWYSDDQGLTWNSATAPTCSVWDGNRDYAIFRRDNNGYAYYAHLYDTEGRDVHIHKGDFNAARTAITWDNTNVIAAQSPNPSGQNGVSGWDIVPWTDSSGDNYVFLLKGEYGTTYGHDVWWAGYHQTGGSGSWTTDKSPTIAMNDTNVTGMSLAITMEHNGSDMYEPISDTPTMHAVSSYSSGSANFLFRFNTSTWAADYAGSGPTETADYFGNIIHLPSLSTTWDIIRAFTQSSDQAQHAPTGGLYQNGSQWGTVSAPEDGATHQTDYHAHGLVYDIENNRMYSMWATDMYTIGPSYHAFLVGHLTYTDDVPANTTTWTTNDPGRMLSQLIGHKPTTTWQNFHFRYSGNWFRPDANRLKHIAQIHVAPRPSDGKMTAWWYSWKYFNSAPTATITVPTDGATFDVENSLSITWTISDPEGDPQAYYTLRRVVDGVTTTYWNGTSWQGSEDASTKIATASKSVILGKNWADAGVDTSHAYSVKVWDDVNSNAGAWSSTVTIYPISSQSTVKGYSLPRPIKRQQDINATLRSNQDYSVSWINTYVPSYGDLNDDLYIRAGVRPGGTSYMRDALPAVIGSFDVGNGTNYYATLGATDVYRTNEYALSSERAKRFRPKRMNDALGIIIGVDVFEYEYKDRHRNGAHASRFGLVAEDLGFHMRRLLDIRQEDNPLLLVKDDTIYLNDQQLIPIMWQAIQELYDIVQDLIPPGQRKERKPIVTQERRVKNE